VKRISFLSYVLLPCIALAQGTATKPAKSQQTGTAARTTAKAAPAAARSVKEIDARTPPLPPFSPQQPKRIELSNGAVIFLQEDHELPLVFGTVTIRGGGIEVPKEKTGMMSIYGQTWRLGGTESMTGDQMDDFLESRAASVSTSGGLQSTSLSWSCLKPDFDDVFKLALDLLQHPAFREDKIALSKTQMNGGISRRNDDIGDIMSREAAKIAYGPDHPYARVPEYDTVAAVTRQDLVDFHQRHLHPNYMIIGVGGDFDPVRMEAALRAAFEPMPKGAPYQKPQLAFPGPQPGIYFAEKPDVNQTEVRMVHLGIQKDNPDLEAVDVMDQIYFAGGFSARFTTDLRTKLGLAYSAGGSISSAYDHPGLFVVGLGTKSEQTIRAIEAMRKEVHLAQQPPPTEQELKEAKDAILNSFIFRYDSKDKLLSERMTLEFYGYPADFAEKYRAGVERVTLADVQRVAAKYIHPEKLATVVVGKAAAFDKPLTTLGQVKEIDISIPPPRGAARPTAAPSGQP